MRAFDRYAPAIVAYHAAFIAMALHFGVVVLKGGSPITPELYGAAVYEIPALTWVAIQIAAHGTAAIGGIIRGRIGAALCAGGALAAAALHGMFTALAQFAPHGTLLSAGAMWIGVSLSMGSFLVAVCSLVRVKVDVRA